MDRTITARSAKTNILLTIGLVIVMGLTAWGVHYQSQQPMASIKPPVTVTAPTSYLSYRGVNGQTAMALLKAHAKVQTKNSSLGEFVVSINGNDGGGKKYWIFYVNGQEAQVGAGAYATKNGDKIEWKLQ